jgi:S-adenosyl-L-methionine hydrolase (adenosine-forming)
MQPSSAPTISFLTDYGLADEFVGVVKGVIRQLAPDASVVDVSHGVAAHDVRAGSLTLSRAVQYLPDGVVLAIVDPGVGTHRRAIAVEVNNDDCRLVFVGPDNGLLAPAVAMAGGATRAFELSNTDLHLHAPGATFAGRDIFAPVAARLAAGMPIEECGAPIDPNTLLPGVLPLSRLEDNMLFAEVLWVDHFGNAQLNVDPEELVPFGDVVSIRFGGVDGRARSARLARAYGELRTGEIGLVIDSYGLISVSLDRASAAKELGLAESMSVVIGHADGVAGADGSEGRVPSSQGASNPVPVSLGMRPRPEQD